MRTLPSPWLSAALLVSAALVASCGADEGNPNAPGGPSGPGTGVGGSAGEGGGEVGGPCSEEGAIQACTGHTATGCFEGLQTCVDGTWSECRWSQATEERFLQPELHDFGALPDGAPRLVATPLQRSTDHPSTEGVAEEGLFPGAPDGMTHRTVGDPCTTLTQLTDCDAPEYCAGLLGVGTCQLLEECGAVGGALTTANVCDPQCHAMTPLPLAFDAAGVSYPWDEGTIGSLPAAALAKGLPTLCDDDSTTDCQFDYRCDSGTCIPYVPGDDDFCAGSNITVGIPCGTSIPVCNRGGTDVTLGGSAALEFGIDAGSEVSENGCGTFSAATKTCSIVGHVIPSGECVSVDCATLDDSTPLDATLDGAWIHAKVGGGDDCNCHDNWSWYEDGASCEEPSCGGGVNLATAPVDVSMMTWIDRSGSMDGGRQNIVCEGFDAFLKLSSSAGLGFELRMWPDGGGYNTSCPTHLVAGTCEGCETDAVGAPADTYFPWRLIDNPLTTFNMDDICNNLGMPGNALFNGNLGGTPSVGALKGCQARALARKAIAPDEAVVAVFVTDGAPSWTGSDCDNRAAVANLATTARLAGIYTAAIAIGISDCPGSVDVNTDCGLMNAIAKNGGTGAGIFLNSTDPAVMTAALSKIKNQFACSRTIPALPSGVNPSDLSVVWTVGGVPSDIHYVGTGVGDCTGADDEFYYDDDVMTLCTAACTAVTGEIGSNIEFVVPCGPSVAPVPPTEHAFEVPDNACTEPGTYPKWTVLYHDAVTPVGTSINIRARTFSEAGGAWNAWHDVATLSGTPATYTDLWPTPLGPDAYSKQIELEFSSTVAVPLAPTMNSYELQFTCEYTE